MAGARHRWARGDRCQVCGARRGVFSGRLRDVYAELRDAPVIVAELQEAWPNADLDYCRVRGLSLYQSPGAATWSRTRPPCDPNPTRSSR